MKQYTIISYHHGSSTEWTGSLQYLEDEVFGYTLECGNSWNPKINRHPKTVKALVNALNKSANECGRWGDYYELKND